MSDTIRIPRGELLRLVAAMEEGYHAAIPEVTTELERGFVLGWAGAFEALKAVAERMPND